MESWMANGAKLGWLINLHQRNVLVYESDNEPRLETGDSVAGIDPVEGFVLDLASV
jgi:hypothetical protein